MKRIAIIGPGGAGKSTLARQIGERLKLPVIHLDAVYWHTGWIETPKDVWEQTVRELTTEDAWITDGNFGGTMAIRLAAADTIIFLDLPPPLCAWRVVRRVLKYRHQSRPDMAPGCPEKLDFVFLKWIWNYRRDRRPDILNRMDKYAEDRKLVHLHTPRIGNWFTYIRPGKYGAFLRHCLCLDSSALTGYSEAMFRRLLLTVCLMLCFAPSTYAAPPQRIVSLSPGTTEMLFALGLGKSVVGDTVYCDYPPAAKTIAKVGDVNTSYEKVLALRPDLIVADGVANARAVARLTALHQPVLAVTPTSLLAVETSLRQIGARTETSKQAALVIAQMEHKARLAAQIAAADKRPQPRVLIVIQMNPLWTCGAGSFIDDLVTRAGGVNIGKAVRGYGPFSKELVLAHPPDVILGDPSSEAAFRSDSLLSRLSATQNGRFYSLPSDLTSRPGPRLADGLVLVAKALHGK